MIQRFGVSQIQICIYFLFYFFTFLQQGHIKLIKSNQKQRFLFQINFAFELFYLSKNPNKKASPFPQKY